MKKMILAIPFAVLLSCSSTRTTTTDADTVMTDETTVDESTAMSGDMTDTTITGSATVAANGTTGVYTSGSATVNNVDYNTMNNGGFDSRNNWRGDSTYWLPEVVMVEDNNPWTATPRSNWYNKNNVTGDDWMSVYYVPVDNGTEPTMITDTSAIFGGWTLTMTPDLATAWRNDLNESGYVYTSAGDNTFASGSATVTTDSGSNASTDMYGGVASSAALGATTDSSMTVTTTTATRVWNNTNGMSPNLYAANGNMYMMPKINLYLNNGSFSGFTGCNSISGRLNVSSNGMLHFENTTPSTNIDCVAGFDQTVLLERLRRVDNYSVVNNQLQLRQGDQVLLVLDKNNQ